jgi:hypothetical protein
MSVSAQIQKALDRMATGRHNSQANFGTGDGFWVIADAAGDQLYENTVKGTDLTDMDTALAGGAVWGATKLGAWFTNHNTYFQRLGLASPYLETYLTSLGWRISQLAADCFTEGTQGVLNPIYVFPKGIRPDTEDAPTTSGMHKFGRFDADGGTAWVATDGVLPSTCIGAGVLAINLAADQTAGGTIRCTCQDGTTKDIVLLFTAAAQYSQDKLGAQAISAPAAAGQKVVGTAATAQFKAGEYVLLWENDSLQEIVKIATIQANTSLTMETDLLNSYTGAGFVIPLFTNAVYQGNKSGAGTVDLFAMPDRKISL